MPKLPRVTGIEATRALERDGWRLVRTSGSHRHFKHESKPGLVTVPIHSGETLYPKLMKSILRQADLTVDEFLELLK